MPIIPQNYVGIIGTSLLAVYIYILGFFFIAVIKDIINFIL